MNIVLCYPVEPTHIDQIQSTAPDATIINAGQQGVADAVLEADIFCGHAKVPVNWDSAVAKGRLRWIQSSAAGLDHCLVPSVVESPISVTSASGLFADQVAEQTMALLLGLVRRMDTFFHAQQAREFIRRPTGDLHGATVGIVGFGGNGQRIAEVLAPFRVRIFATDRFPQPRPAHVEAVWPADQLSRLLEAADIVILSLPLNDETRGLFDETCFQRMKPGALLINVARGPIVQESCLVDALQSQRLAGAGLDVTETEPLPTSSPLWTMDRVIITPHVGAQSLRRVSRTTDFFCENLRRFRQGNRLLNLVDKRLGFPVAVIRPDS